MLDWRVAGFGVDALGTWSNARPNRADLAQFTLMRFLGQDLRFLAAGMCCARAGEKRMRIAGGQFVGAGVPGCDERIRLPLLTRGRPTGRRLGPSLMCMHFIGAAVLITTGNARLALLFQGVTGGQVSSLVIGIAPFGCRDQGVGVQSLEAADDTRLRFPTVVSSRNQEVHRCRRHGEEKPVALGSTLLAADCAVRRQGIGGGFVDGPRFRTAGFREPLAVSSLSALLRLIFWIRSARHAFWPCHYPMSLREGVIARRKRQRWPAQSRMSFLALVVGAEMRRDASITSSSRERGSG